MGGVNTAIQLAAALNRRGISVSLDQRGVIVHIHLQETMLISPHNRGPRPYTYGREWYWEYGGQDGRHHSGDWEGAADAVEKFLRSQPGMKDTALLYRMDHMGWTREEETQEALERARAAATARQAAPGGGRCQGSGQPIDGRPGRGPGADGRRGAGRDHHG
jgi:hypothetical protein